jgi:hypothetical protein
MTRFRYFTFASIIYFLSIHALAGTCIQIAFDHVMISGASSPSDMNQVKLRLGQVVVQSTKNWVLPLVIKPIPQDFIAHSLGN